MTEHHHPLTHDDVIGVVGELDDDLVAAIIATGADLEELTEAFVWASDEADSLIAADKPRSGRVEQLYEILMRDEEWPEPGRS